MSMWLNLAKVTPELLTEIRADPELLELIFFDEDELPEGLSATSDVFGCDYRTLSEVAQAVAGLDRPGVDWRERFVWLSRATGENEADHLVGYDFTYGPAFTLAPPDVVRVAEGMAGEDWSFEDDDDDLEPFDLSEEDDAATDADKRAAEGDHDIAADLEDDDLEDEDEDDDEGDGDDDEYEDFADLVPFFVAAAREGKAIVGGVS